jgi:hypothetical protein
MKRCILCGSKAQFGIKNSNEYYCKECAEMQFGDLGYLIEIK